MEINQRDLLILKNMKNKILILILILGYPLYTGFIADEKKPGRSDVSSGYIDITVESNINKVLFTYNLNDKGYQFREIAYTADPENASEIRIVVPVKEFQCSNHIAYKDFISLLKVSQFPYLSISLPRDEIVMTGPGDMVEIRDVLITIAGLPKKYNINCRIIYSSEGDPVLVGTTKIRLTDLDILPPVKSFGLIKIKDEIIVRFGFSLNEEVIILTKN